jgi:hypothetical protein
MRNTLAQHDSLSAFCARRRRTIDVILTDVSQIVLLTLIEESKYFIIFVRRLYLRRVHKILLRFVTHKALVVGGHAW